MVGKLHEYPRRIAFSEGTHTIFGQGSRFARWLCHCAASTITHFLIPFVTGEVLRRCHCKVRQHFPERVAWSRLKALHMGGGKCWRLVQN